MQFHDPQAREAMIRAHMGLVRRVAARLKSVPLCFEDRMSEGVLGLIAAVDAFDPARGVGFTTFAERSIRAAIQRAARAERRFHRFAARSLEQPMEDGEERIALGDTVAGNDGETVAERTALQAEIAAALQSLPPRQAEALRLRFGLGSGSPLSFVETAQRLCVSETRLAQLLASAQKRMRRALSGSRS